MEIIVLGIGNILCSDEGIGVKTIYELQKRDFDERIEIVDGGCDGLSLLRYVEAADYLLVVDAINADEDPGTIIELHDDEIPDFPGIRLSPHQGSFQELLSLARLRDRMPKKVIMLGVQPESLDWAGDLTETIASKMPILVNRAEEIIRDWEKEL